MGAKSSIEWTNATWTPIRARDPITNKVGWHCERVSTGCGTPTEGGCYSEAMNRRFGTGLPFKPGHRNVIDIFLDEEMLLAPLRWRKPRMIFVCSMTDAFADFVKDEWLDKMFYEMERADWHTYQVLTKRAKRMQKYITRRYKDRAPPKHIWLGVSAERQQEADERIPHLLQTPAAIRFVSLEPLLGPIDLVCRGCGTSSDAHYISCNDLRRAPLAGLDWVIVGGESGLKARPMHPDWARSLQKQCESAGVKFFFKQHGEWLPKFASDGWSLGKDHIVFDDAGLPKLYRGWPPGGGTNAPPQFLERVGKKAAGRLLDGIEHNGMPNEFHHA